MTCKNLGRKIRHERKRMGKTLQEVGEAVGCGKEYIWQLENKNFSNISADLLFRISDFLEVCPRYLVDDDSP